MPQRMSVPLVVNIKFMTRQETWCRRRERIRGKYSVEIFSEVFLNLGGGYCFLS